MMSSVEDKALIKNLHPLKGYGSRKWPAEFPEKKLDKTRFRHTVTETTGYWHCTDRRVGSGRPRTAHTEDNVTQVEELVLSQEGAPHSHRSTRQISRKTALCASVVGLTHNSQGSDVEAYEKAASPGADLSLQRS